MAMVLGETRGHLLEGHPVHKMGRLFEDQIFTATDLNRRGGAILDLALSKPVTITRNDQHFALLRRELVADLSALRDQVNMFTEVMGAIRSMQSGNKLHDDHPYRWLQIYEADDLAVMSDELMEAFAEVNRGEDLEAVEGVIHEWHESAIAAASEVLDEAFAAESNPINLTPPPSDQDRVDE